ncbi:MBL fold metallo-hydrolase [Parahaliea sp. F7430]|uniref:MBL fold metallo-hydrolase n=1 Tax=Sediminihaliea albiluteola TaxID=2758564 RepID=A0A7W2TXB8_9GAMM|nr:MBL fold metallo-hydrolase [Sediminihaliea albiluteola]MBA6413678.1 MBL fold metallo-hydrolase [Sediminihaliea albiluteola]
MKCSTDKSSLAQWLRYLALLICSASALSYAGADVDERVDDLTRLSHSVTALNDFIYRIDGQGSIFLINTSEGSVLIDVGSDEKQGAEQKRLAQELASGPIRKIILSHFHSDHVAALPVWEEELSQGLPIVTHQRYAYMSQIQRELSPFFNRRYKILYGDLVDESPKEERSYWQLEPEHEVYVGKPYSFSLGAVDFEIIAMNNTGEGEDGLLVWLPQHKILFVGDMFGPIYPMFPNLYTVRGEKYRDALDYIDSLDFILSLQPEMMVCSHFCSLNDPQEIQNSVLKMRDAVQYVWDEVVEGMNAGKSLWQLMDEISLPKDFAISQGHGKVSWSVRAIWETVSGWYHYQHVADLYPVPVASVYGDVVAAAGGVGSLLQKAKERQLAGELVHALRLLDILRDSETEEVLTLRLAVLDGLLEQAQALRNYSEIGLLRHDRQQSAERLKFITGDVVGSAT